MSVSVVVPTFNEAQNIGELVTRVSAIAADAEVKEILFIDDSTDNTPDVIAAVSAASTLPVRLIHRTGAARTGGLSGAVAVGLRAATGDWVIVMDGDLQHPPEDLPRIIQARTDVDMVVASRYRHGGNAAGLSSPLRRTVSRLSTFVARGTFPDRLDGCTDPMTGFFAVRRQALDVDLLRPQGFKVLLEILGRHNLRIAEVPFRFADRVDGRSKATFSHGMSFARQLIVLRMATAEAVGRPATPSAWSQRARFATVGLVNLVVDIGIFNVLLHTTAKPLTAKLVASTVAISSSYVLNRRWTWRHRPGLTTGSGLLSFGAVALVGVAVAESCLLLSHYILGLRTPLADNISANVIGLGLSMVLRYRLCDRWVFPDLAEVEPERESLAA